MSDDGLAATLARLRAAGSEAGVDATAVDDDAAEFAIFASLCKDGEFSPTPDCAGVLRTMLHGVIRDREFGNARFIRNVFEAAVVRQAWRLRSVEKPTVDELRALEAEDLPSTSR